MKQLSIIETHQISGGIFDGVTIGETEAMQVGFYGGLAYGAVSVMKMTWGITTPIDVLIFLTGGPFVGAGIGYGAYHLVGEAIKAWNNYNTPVAAQA